MLMPMRAAAAPRRADIVIYDAAVALETPVTSRAHQPLIVTCTRPAVELQVNDVRRRHRLLGEVDRELDDHHRVAENSTTPIDEKQARTARKMSADAR